MKVRIQAKKDMWRDIAEYLFVAYEEITLYFKPDMIIARDLTPDHVALYDVRVKKDYFYGYKFEVVEDGEPVVFAVNRRDFLRAIREAKADLLELVYDEKSGELKLDGFTVGRRDDFRKSALTLPDPKIKFANEATIEDVQLFKQYATLTKRMGKYAPNMIATFVWKGYRLKIIFWDEKNNVIVEFPEKPIKIEKYEEEFTNTYTILFDIPTVHDIPLTVEMAKDGPARFSLYSGFLSFTLYVAPRVERHAPQLPELVESVGLEVDLAKYLLRFIYEKNIADNVLTVEKNYLKFIGENISRNMLTVIEIEYNYSNLTKEIALETRRDRLELAERVCELLGEAELGIDSNDNVRFCNVRIGWVTRPQDVQHLKDLLEDLSSAYEKRYSRYAHITVLGGKLVKALEKAERLRALVWSDLVEVEINGTKWGKPDLEEVTYPGVYAAMSVDAETVPIIPVMRLVSNAPVRISFDGWGPVVVSYGLLKSITGLPKLKVTGYLANDVDDLTGWLEAKGLLKPPSDLAILFLVKDMPGVTSADIARELLFMGLNPRGTLAILEKLKAQGRLREENYRYYLVEKAPPPVEVERERVLKDVERLKEEISKVRPEAEKLSRDVDEVLEHLSPFVKTARGYLEQLDKIGRLTDAEFDRRIGEVEKLVADAEAFLRKYREDRALARLDERLSNIKKKLEELKAKVDEFGGRAEELRGRLAKLGLSPSMAEAQPLNLATLGELIIEKIPYRLDTVEKDLWLIEVTLKASVEQTKRRLEERRKPKPAVPREIEEHVASIRSELDKFTKEYVSYMGDVEAYNLAFNKHMATLNEIREKLRKPKYYSENVLREFREAIEKARRWSEEVAREEVKLRDRQSALLRKAQKIGDMLMKELATKARAYGVKTGDVPGFSDLVRRVHDLVMSIRNNPPKNTVDLKDEIKRVEEILEKAERELSILPTPKFRAGDRVRWVKKPPHVAEESFIVREEPEFDFARGKWVYVIDGKTVPEDELEPVTPPAKPPEVKPPVEVRPPPVRPPTLLPEVKATPPPAPPVAPRTVEEARPIQRAVEDFLASRVRPPRPEITKPVVRVDWHDGTYGWLGARISYHREAEGQLLKALEEAGCKVERVVEAKPPLKIAYVDCRGARVTAVAPPPAPPKPAPPPLNVEQKWRELVERAKQLVEEWVALYVPKAKQETVRLSFQRAVREAEETALADARAAVQAGKPELAVRTLEEAVNRVLRDTARIVASVAPKAREHPEIVRLLGPPPAPPAPPATPTPAEMPPGMPLAGPPPPGVRPEVWKWAKWLAKLEAFATRRGPPTISDLGIKFARVYGHPNPFIQMFPPMSSVEDDRVVLALRTVEGLAYIGGKLGLRVEAKFEWSKGELLKLLDEMYRRGDERVREWVDELRGQIGGG